MIFIIRNIQVYFDHCSTCTNQRNVLLRGLFFNQTAFKEPFYLLLNNRYFFAQICSIPNISHFSNDHHFSSSPDGWFNFSLFLVMPQRLDLTDLNKTTTHQQSRLHFDLSTSNYIHIDSSTADVISTTFIGTSERSIHFTTDYSPTTDTPDRITS